jgi:myo-inositol-1(or 4)-monophosphatase
MGKHPHPYGLGMSSRRLVDGQDWLPVFSRMGVHVRQAILPLLGTEGGGREIGTTGAGGDRTLEVDRQAEEVVMTEFQSLAAEGHRFSVLSEEVGLVDFGAEYPRVVVDPVDGSSNARRGGLCAVGVVFSLLDGPTVGDVSVGYTIDVLTGQEWTALRNSGAFSNNRPLLPLRAAEPDHIEVLCLHALPRDLPNAWGVLTRAVQFRQLWCVSLSLVHTADGGMDLFCSPRLARVFDMTAGFLMMREVGGAATDMNGLPLTDLPVDLSTRTTVLCSAHPSIHSYALSLIQEQRNEQEASGRPA